MRWALWTGGLLCCGAASAQDAAVEDPPAPDAPAPDAPPADEDAGEVLVVTGSRTQQRLSDATVATEVITAEEIAASGARNVGELLSTHAGIEVSQSFRGATAEIRGLDPSYVLVIVDGMRVGGRSDGAVDLSRFPVEDIEQIEVVKGPVSALYGADGLAGVIHIRTRKPQRPWELSGGLTLGSRVSSGTAPVTEVPMGGLFPASNGLLSRTDAELGAGFRKDRWFSRASAGLRASGAYDLNPEDEATSGSAWREWSLGERAGLQLGQDQRLNGGLQYRRRETRGVDPGAGGAVYDLTNLTEELTASLAPDLLFAGPARLQVSGQYSLYRDQFLQDQRGSDALDLYQESWEHLAELSAQLDRVYSDQNTATVGVDGLFESLRSPRLSTGEAARQRLAIFAADEWIAVEDGVFKRLAISPGARLDLDTQFGSAMTPKLSARLDPVKPLVLRAGVGRGYRAPDFKELYLLFENPTAGYRVLGNPDLQPETSWSADLGLAWDPVKALQLSLTAFRNDIDNLIQPELVADPDPLDGMAPYQMVNVAKARTEGLEASVGLRVPERWSIDAGGVFLRARDLTADLPLDGRPGMRFTLEARAWRLPGELEATARGAWTGPQPFTDDWDGDGDLETEDAAAYLDLSLRLARDLGKNLSLAVGGDNLLDAGDPSFYRLPPRLLYLSLSARVPGGGDR